jgi:F0F1-type ATP synthase assembly protein I
MLTTKKQRVSMIRAGIGVGVIIGILLSRVAHFSDTTMFIIGATSFVVMLYSVTVGQVE